MFLKRKETPVQDEPLLQGARIFMRPTRLQDWPQWRDVRAKNSDWLREWEPQWPADALTEAYFKKRAENFEYESKAGRSYVFLIFLRKNNALIGGINLNNVCRGSAQFATLGYWLDEGQQDQGYMTEAANVLIAHAFSDLGLHRINAGCLPDNRRSRQLLTRLGFKEEGFAPRYLEINGKWADHVLYGLTIEDWQARQSA